MSKLCGLCSASKPLPPSMKVPKQLPLPSTKEKAGPTPSLFREEHSILNNTTSIERNSDSFEIARENRLSVILEVDSTRNTPNWDKRESAEIFWEDTPPRSLNRDRLLGRKLSTAHFSFDKPDRDDIRRRLFWEEMASIAETKAIKPPPRDLESIARIDNSLVFAHFTTEDAWMLGSALRERLMLIEKPVVINIALANQNQVLFHTCTHSGVMPDNDNWVARKRKTVLRWGVSTWYMSCKFDGDEVAFRDKYGLGNSAGEYAIHGGGVPIRVTGVEGVVAVVVVSGLKQDEDHAIVVEVIRDLYY